MQGTVVHLDEANPEEHADVLRNIRNLLNELDDGSAVELVAHGAGITAVLSAGPSTQEVADLVSQGVSVVACQNTMTGKGISAEELTAGVTIVPAGVAQLVRRQREGWAYIRP